jgi:hypothetical protein
MVILGTISAGCENADKGTAKPRRQLRDEVGIPGSGTSKGAVIRLHAIAESGARPRSGPQHFSRPRI